ncbi:hypothetical protein BJX68DRAFT_222866 [Aspergillus pseudodeflectus]|uniref:Response regulatory domain-containing protein n=1 Tax=Aspergillus pseudodeflectus TaxID=176178 RepID=A0ABR4LAL0_9EURO
MHILFVDDNRVWQKIALLKLPKIGCTVAVASDGQEALNYLSARPEHCPRPDLIMMDASYITPAYSSTMTINPTQHILNRYRSQCQPSTACPRHASSAAKPLSQRTPRSAPRQS